MVYCTRIKVNIIAYTGYAAGGLYSHTGSGSNYLCLPEEPLWGHFDDGTTGESNLYHIACVCLVFYVAFNTLSVISRRWLLVA